MAVIGRLRPTSQNETGLLVRRAVINTSRQGDGGFRLRYGR